MSLELVHETRGTKAAFAIEEGETRIGRGKKCDLRLRDRSVSKLHATLISRGGTVEIVDAGSRNGISVNGRIVERAELAPGDAIRVGKVALEVAVAASLEPAPPAARLVAIAGARSGSVFELAGGGPITIGSREDNAVRLEGEGISRKHAQVRSEGTSWVILDLASRNGLLVGEARVAEKKLEPGDEIQIGTARLRFEVVAPIPAPPVAHPRNLASLLERVKNARALVANPRALKGAVVLVAALLFAIATLWPKNAPEQTGTSSREDASALEDAVREALAHLRLGRAQEAERVLAPFERGDSDRPPARALSELARILEQRDYPLTFEWARARTALERAGSALKGLADADALAWIEDTRKAFLSEEPNAQLAEKAQRDFLEAASLKAKGNGREETDALVRALAGYRSIPSSSKLHAQARLQIEKVRGELLEAYDRGVAKCVQGASPDWKGALALVECALTVAESPDERSSLRKRQDDIEANAKDEASLARAETILQGRELARYDEARDLLLSIRKASRAADSAQLDLEWLDADRLVRKAREAYDEGDWDRARSLLEKGLEKKTLLPDARASIASRLAAWKEVHALLARGADAADKGETTLACECFEKLLELERSEKNRFRRIAREQLATIRENARRDLDALLAKGQDALTGGRYREANDCFRRVLLSRASEQIRHEIEEAVARANHREQLFKEAQAAWFAGDSSRFEEIKAVTLLLRNFLPVSDPDEKKADDLHALVKERLETRTLGSTAGP